MSRFSAARVVALLPSRSDYALLPRTWRTDVVAGLTVGIVALPLALAFGVSSGAGAEAGLITAIVAGLVAGIFGGSHVQVSGPTGAMVAVLGPIIAIHGLKALAVVTLMAGVVVAGALRLGRAVGAIPWPVIEGFTAGIAVIIFLQQVPSALGVAAGGHGGNAVLSSWRSVRQATAAGAWPTLAIVAAVAAMMLIAPRVNPRLPGSIIAIVGVTVVASVGHLDVATIGALPVGLPLPSAPGIGLATAASLVGLALTIAALAAIESLLSARVAASLADTGPYDADRELVGQGLASIASSFFGGMPATGAIARTAVNVRTGGRTRLAAVVHALSLLIIVTAASALVSGIPLAALSGVLMVTAVRMVPRRTVVTVVRASRQNAVVFTLTGIVTVSVDLIYAVAIGIAAAALFALRALSRSAGVHREEIPGPAVAGDAQIALFRIDGALFFGAAERVMERVASIQGVHVVILRMSQVQLMDSTGAQVLTELVTGLERRGVTVLVKGIQPQHLELARRVGVLRALKDESHVYEDLASAVEHARSHVADA